MSIVIVSDLKTWFNPILRDLKFTFLQLGHRVLHVNHVADLVKADVCFYLSFSKIVSRTSLDLFKNNLVAHSSDLPNGKGWSPLTWQILGGKNEITTVLFEATENVDDGEIYLKTKESFSGYELLGELHQKQGEAIIKMCIDFVQQYPNIVERAIKQTGEATFFSKRSPKDSYLDIDRSLREQFNLFRVADNERYPVYFKVDDHSYILRIEHLN